MKIKNSFAYLQFKLGQEARELLYFFCLNEDLSTLPHKQPLFPRGALNNVFKG